MDRQDFKRSVDFHVVLLAMAGHDLRQHLQVILGTYAGFRRCRFDFIGICRLPLIQSARAIVITIIAQAAMVPANPAG